MDKTKETGNQVSRSYKDRLFRMVFREKKELRSWSGGRTIYGRQLVKIPTPRFFVFYNGRDMQPERQVCTKLKKGKTQEVIAEELEENLSTIRSICEAAEEFAPEYDWKKVMKKTGAYVEKKC